MSSIRNCVILPLLLAIPAVAPGENLVANPSAEQASETGAPRGWGKYVGAGGVTLCTSTDEKHSGHASACLELTEWYTPEDAPDPAEKRSASGAVMLADNNGYGAQGALPCSPETTYAFSFWYKGDVRRAAVRAIGWPSADAGSAEREYFAVSGGAVRPGPDWQRCTGSFRTGEEVRCFALMIHTGGKEKEGFALGRLYVDDARIVPKVFPDGELRAVWWGWPKSADREEGLREIDQSVEKLQAAGFNTLFVSARSLYIAALDRPELQTDEPRAAWDAFGQIIEAAKRRNMQVHAWFSPWVYKRTSSAVELRDHPEWAAVSSEGVADSKGLCFSRPEVRQFELDLVARLIDRYPELAGIHVEEPGHNWGAEYCYCDYCRRLCREWFGVDIREDPAAARPVVRNLAAFMSTDFFARLRQMMLAKRPEMWLSANGSGGRNTDWHIGRDWTTWARRGYIDFYVPQLYTKSVEAFMRRGRQTKTCLGECDLVTGMAVTWSSIYPERQDPEVIAAEIRAARKLGAKGFVVFHRNHFYDEHYEAVRKSVAGDR